MYGAQHPAVVGLSAIFSDRALHSFIHYLENWLLYVEYSTAPPSTTPPRGASALGSDRESPERRQAAPPTGSRPPPPWENHRPR